MLNGYKENILTQLDDFISYLDTLQVCNNVNYTDDEVNQIIARESQTTQANLNQAIRKFAENNKPSISPKVKRFAVYWGYPGAGKSVMTQKLVERFTHDEDCLPFNIIDKDQHRELFPNLFDHLKNGHLDECERFAGVAIDYVRTIMDISLQKGSSSILSIGSMGAGSEFKDNALKAISYGYRPCAIYMAVPKEIAYLSNIYRSATLYEQIIFHNQQLYPRLVSCEYFNRVVQMLPNMIEKIDHFQQEYANEVDLMVLNRQNQLLYDTRKTSLENIQDVIFKEENRILLPEEVATIHMQLYKIRRNIQYRYENNLYPPCQNEIQAARQASCDIYRLIQQRYPLPTQHNTPKNFSVEFTRFYPLGLSR